MTRTPTVNLMLMRGLALGLPLLALACGCAGRKPVAEMARADQAVRHAQTTSEAERYAPVELTSARAKLASARRALDDGDYPDARRLAEQALADAQLAEAKAESQVAREQASRTRSEIQVIQAEAVAPDTVVVERRAASPEPLVVERTTTVQSAPVTVRQVPVTVRQEPTTVVVEHPQPAPGVVIQRDPAVIVVPE